MEKWRVGSKVCEGCGQLLSIKSKSNWVDCYLCDTRIDLSDLPVIEEAGAKQESKDEITKDEPA